MAPAGRGVGPAVPELAGLAGRLQVQGEVDVEGDAAVVIRKAYKEYRSKSLFRKPVGNLVIKGLDMTVRRGTM